MTTGTEESETGVLRRLLSGGCPHWWRLVPDYGDAIMMDITKRERCRLCKKERVHAKVPEPHPSRDKEDVLEKVQHPKYEVVVEEWLPYGSKGP